MRSRFVAGAAVAAVLLPAVPAQAATPGQVRVSGSWMFLTSGGTAVNNIRIEPTPDGYTITDTANPLTLDPAQAGVCVQETPARVRCRTWYLVRADLGAGDDRFDNALGSNLEVTVWAGDGNDQVFSGLAPDILHGGSGNDVMYGGAGNDFIYGGAGSDSLYGDDGVDWLDGEGGSDDLRGGAGGDRLANSDRTADDVWGEDGDDMIWSANRMWGGNGNDYVIVQTGFGDYYGGEGTDTLDYVDWPHSTLVMSMDGNDNDGAVMPSCPWWLNCSDDRQGQHNVHGDFERILGTPGDDHITGNNEPDVIEGRGGNDRLFGKGGDDTLHAGPGAGQTTDGGTGTDACRGDGLTNTAGCDNF